MKENTVGKTQLIIQSCVNEEKKRKRKIPKAAGLRLESRIELLNILPYHLDQTTHQLHAKSVKTPPTIIGGVLHFFWFQI